jgi:hypothetical protein
VKQWGRDSSRQTQFGVRPAGFPASLARIAALVPSPDFIVNPVAWDSAGHSCRAACLRYERESGRLMPSLSRMSFGPALFSLRSSGRQLRCASAVRAKIWTSGTVWPNGNPPAQQSGAAPAELLLLSGQPMTSDGKRAAPLPAYFHCRDGIFRKSVRHRSGRHIGPTAPCSLVADILDSGPGPTGRMTEVPPLGSRAAHGCGANPGEPTATRRPCCPKASPARSIQRIEESLGNHEKRNAGQCLSAGGMPDRHC